MLKDESFLEQCDCYLKDEYFDGLYLGWLFSTVTKLWKRFKKVPSIETLKNEISKFSSDERLPYGTILENVLACQYEDYDYLRCELARFVKSSIFFQKQQEIIELYNSGKYDKSFDEVQEFAGAIDAINFDRDDSVDLDKMEAIMDGIRKETDNKIKIGIPVFDKAMNGGIPRGSLLVFLGSTNVGKSLILTNSACNLIKAGKKVYYVDVEMSADIVLTRFIGCLTGISLNRLVRSEALLLESENQKIREAKELMKKFLKIKILQEELVDVDSISAICRTNKKRWGFDAFIVDSGQELGIRDKFNSNYERQGAIYQRLSRIALANEIVVISSAQGNREASKKSRTAKKRADLLRMEDVSDSFTICRKAAVVITITRSDRDSANDRINLLLAKQRLGPTDIAVTYHTDFNSGRIFGTDMECEMYYQDGSESDDEEKK